MLCLTANETVSIFDFAGNPFPQNVVSCCTEMNFLNSLSAVNMTVASKFDVPLCSCCSCPRSDNCHRVVAVPWGPTAGGAAGHGAGSAPWAFTCFFGGISQQVTAVLLEIVCGVSRGVGISSTGQAGIPQHLPWDGAGGTGPLPRLPPGIPLQDSSATSNHEIQRVFKHQHPSVGNCHLSSFKSKAWGS